VHTLVGACGGEPPSAVGSWSGASTVADVVGSSCSTSVVLELSRQIADEVDCMAPGTLTSFTAGGGIEFTGSAVLPYLAPDAKADLLAAQAAFGGTIQVNSAYRTVAQQYLLYRWWQEGRCGITAAATPGNSNHETGRAVDLNNWDQLVGVMENHGWDHTVPGDPVHFDHLASPDLRGADVLAFQRLWNRNHPADAIAEDGDYGPQTAARLATAPTGGFPIGPCPDPTGPEWDAARGASEVPTEMVSGERAVAWFELENTGSRTWNVDSTRLGTLEPEDHASAFFDEENWISPSRPTGVDHAAAPGAAGRFSFVIKAPVVTEDTVVVETFGVVEEGVTWFGPSGLTVEILVHPTEPGPEQPVDPLDPPDPAGSDGLSGGCSAAAGRTGDRTGGAGSAAVGSLALLVALYAFVRHRRAACSSLPAGNPPEEEEHADVESFPSARARARARRM
jgi:hypothetical protein